MMFQTNETQKSKTFSKLFRIKKIVAEENALQLKFEAKRKALEGEVSAYKFANQNVEAVQLKIDETQKLL